MHLRSTRLPSLLSYLLVLSISLLLTIPVIAQNGPDLELDTTFYVVPEHAVALTHLFNPQYFAINVHNRGDATANEVTVNCLIRDVTGGEEIFFVEKNYGDLLPGESIENEVLNEEAFELPLTNFFEERTYEGRYTVTSLNDDTNSENDTLYFYFYSSYKEWAKETGRTSGIRLEGLYNYIGTSFYVPEGVVFEVRDLEFMVDNADEIVTGNGSVVFLLYETLGDQNQDGIIDTMEYNNAPIYFNEYSFLGDENQTLVRFPIDLDTEGPYDRLELPGGKHYLAVLNYVGEDEEDTMVISVSEEYDYTANREISNQQSLPQYAHVYCPQDSLSSLGRPNFVINSLGADINPLIRLKPFYIMGNSLTNSLPPEYRIVVAPNPANEQFMLNFDFPESTETNMALFNQEGRLLKTYTARNVYQETITESCEGLPNGIYSLRIVTEKGSASRRVIVHH